MQADADGSSCQPHVFVFITEVDDMETGAEDMEGMPVGNDNFRKLRDRDLYYVDKTPLIDMVLKDSSDVMLFTRPRRFGKSLNMSMLDAYLNIKYAGERDRFSDLKISELRPNDPDKNSNIVIKLDLKDLGNGEYAHFLKRMEKTLFNLYQDFLELRTSDKLNSGVIDVYNRIYERRSEPSDLESSLADLCMMLAKHYGKAPIILIDEYDNIMNRSYGKPKEHKAIMDFMRTFLGTALKGNEYMRFAVLTGVTRISKESIFSGVNNFRVYDLFSTQYDEMFGFTHAEVEKLLADNGHPEKLAEAQEWYDGYRFGNADVYNPWSILMYVDTGFEATPHWAGTSDNAIIWDLLRTRNKDVWNDLKALCSGGTVTTGIDREIAYDDLRVFKNSVFSIMVAAGYLNAVPDGSKYSLSIPNKEMFRTFAKQIIDRTELGANATVLDFVDAVKTGDVESITANLKLLMPILSNRILDSEHSYQSFIAGLMANSAGRFEIKAEREAGEGYYDIRMRRLRGAGANVIIEIKRRNKKNAGMSMEDLAKAALRQIHEKEYYSEMEGECLLYGLSFKGKQPTVIMETYNA